MPNICWLILVVMALCSDTGLAADVPFVFEGSADLSNLTADQIRNISASSPELAGVPGISTSNDSDIVLFPESRTYKTVGELKNEYHRRVLQNTGLVLLNQGRFSEAFKAFDQSIRLDPTDARAWNLKGIALMAMSRCEEAIRCFDVAIALDPLFAAAWNNKAEALYATGNYDEANAACDRAIQIDPSAPDAWYTKGRILKTQSREAFTKARKIELAA